MTAEPAILEAARHAMGPRCDCVLGGILEARRRCPETATREVTTFCSKGHRMVELVCLHHADVIAGGKSFYICEADGCGANPVRTEIRHLR